MSLFFNKQKKLKMWILGNPWVHNGCPDNFFWLSGQNRCPTFCYLCFLFIFQSDLVRFRTHILIRSDFRTQIFYKTRLESPNSRESSPGATLRAIPYAHYKQSKLCTLNLHKPGPLAALNLNTYGKTRCTARATASFCPSNFHVESAFSGENGGKGN